MFSAAKMASSLEAIPARLGILKELRERLEQEIKVILMHVRMGSWHGIGD
jgi:hypothetical protein